MSQHQKLMLSQNTVRYEVQYKKMKPLKGLLATLADLKDESVYESLKVILLKKFNQITFKDNFSDTSFLKQQERQLYYAGRETAFWEEEKTVNPKGHHNIRTKYNRILEKVNGRSPPHHLNLTKELKDNLIQQLKKL